jgi:Big-like domain-containing protein
MNSGPRLASRSFKPMTIGSCLTALLILIGNTCGLVSLAYAGGSDTTTTTSLVLSSNSLVAGNSLLLTATVIADPPPVTRGVVTFCDATAARCDGAAVLGIAHLTSAGTATLTLTLGVGTYSIDAIYQGYAAYGVVGSTSTAQALTVNGNPDNLYLSSTAIGATGSRRQLHPGGHHFSFRKAAYGGDGFLY